MISQFIALLPRSDSRGAEIKALHLEAFLPRLSLLIFFLSRPPLPLLQVELPTSEHHQVISAVSPLVFTHSFSILTPLHSALPPPPPRPPSTPRLPDLIYHSRGSVSQTSCLQSARGRWDDEQASVWAFVSKWLPPRCSY